MLLNRKDLIDMLNCASIGISKKELFEQSHCFVFENGSLITFNDEILTRVKCPIDFNFVVPAKDLIKLLEKFKEDEVSVENVKNEIVIKGKKKSAGLVGQMDVNLPYKEVPNPEKWFKLSDECSNLMRQAAMTCDESDIDSQFSMIHVDKDKIEACDNYRLFHADIKTGFEDSVLLPSHAMKIITGSGNNLRAVFVGRGWVHFATDKNMEISVRCSHERYNDVSHILNVEEGTKVTLPKDIIQSIERAKVMMDTYDGANIKVAMEDGNLTITSRKDTGWYKEKRKVRYEGPAITFEAQPDFLIEILSRTRDVLIADNRMKIEVDKIQFVVSLIME